MFRISGIIAFQTKKSNLDGDLRKETAINELQRKIGNFFTPFFLAEPHSHHGKEKETHEWIFSWLSWLAVLLVGAYARRRSRATWRPYSK